MGYKDDLRKINAALRNPESRCYDPLAGKPLVNNINERKVANQRKLAKARAGMKWRRLNRQKYLAYMRAYNAQRRAMGKVAGVKSEGESGARRHEAMGGCGGLNGMAMGESDIAGLACVSGGA
jgi:hypothetical protein